MISVVRRAVMKPTMRAALLVVIVSVFRLSAFAEEMPTTWPQAMNNLAHEYTECAAFYLIVSKGIKDGGNDDLAADYAAVAKTALSFAKVYAVDAGLLDETTDARLSLALEKMTQRIAYSTANIAILTKDYAMTCKVAMEDTDSRLAYWTSGIVPGR